MMRELIAFGSGCARAEFVARQKRFTVVCRGRGTHQGSELLAHTNNTGSMLGLLRPGSEVLLSPAANPARKLRWTWELVRHQGFWVGINTQTPNRLLRLGWEQEELPEVRGYTHFRPEARAGQSRLDGLFLRNRPDLEQGGKVRITAEDVPAEDRLWVECKNVTLTEDEVALFPDAVTERGQKHLRELMALARTGARVALFFVVQRPDARCFGPADMIDPIYAELFWQAVDAGVEVWPYEARVSERGIGLARRLPLVCRP